MAAVDDVEIFFDIHETNNWIQTNQFKRVALQFSDLYLPYSTKIFALIESQCDCQCFILADTSYLSCCIDEVVAQHANADCIVHYGETCLSKRSGILPVRYVFGRSVIDFELLSLELRKGIGDLSGTCALLYESKYGNISNQLFEFLSNLYAGKIIHIELSRQRTESISKGLLAHLLTSVSLGRRIPADFDSCDNLTVIFIGNKNSSLLSLWLLTHTNCTNVVLHCPETSSCSLSSSNSSRLLYKRLYLVEKMRDANTVGLVVGTLNTSGHRDVVKRMRTLCKNARKKLYVFCVGKINEAKLSNFANDVDIFVIVSCPMGIALEKQCCVRPIISLFEAEIALNSYCELNTRGWTAEFDDFLYDEIGTVNVDEPSFSLVSGRLRNVETASHCEDVGDCRDVSLYTAGKYFEARTWKGLDDQCKSNEDECFDLLDGRCGIATCYDVEPARD